MSAVVRPAYLKAAETGELAERVRVALERLSCCQLCPRNCKVNRLAGELGACNTGRLARVASYSPHFGEESPLVGSGGSGTIFFAHCNLFCVFCQNYEISHLGEGAEIEDGQLAAMMIGLQEQGCQNINFVTPSHVVAQILAALPLAIEKGLTIPLVYNSSSYDQLETLKLLDGIIDLYLPDFKFWSRESARRYAKAPDYPEQARQALREMHRQVGDLQVDAEGVATRGLLVRHLVMPEGLEETGAILHFLATDISPRTYVNIMDQYRPAGRAGQYPPLDRQITAEEYRQALQIAKEEGLTRLDQRDWLRLFQRLEEI